MSTQELACDCDCHHKAHRQDEFNTDLCELFVALGLAWHAADNAATHIFFEKWVPGIKVPDRRKLSGKCLDAAAAKVQTEVMKNVGGKVATGQCDGWKNVAKTSVVSSMMTVERQVSLV